MRMAVVHTIDEYIAQYQAPVRGILQKIRETIQSAAPMATEKISYGIPTFFEGENLVHFAAAKRHIGFYPTPSGIGAFAGRLTDYHTSKGAVQFPLDQPIPYGLISEITAFRVNEAREKHMKR
jgi:uncharacterized protein YdhG (YjbR/CyaY superfamily)